MIHYMSSIEEAEILKAELNEKRKGSADIVQGNLCEIDSYEKIISRGNQKIWAA